MTKKKEEKAIEPKELRGLQELDIDTAVEDFVGSDSTGYTPESDGRIYMRIRQKNLIIDGKIVRNPGQILLGRTKEPTVDDFDTITGVLLFSANERTRFVNPDDDVPECGSKNDVYADDWGYFSQRTNKTTGEITTTPRLCDSCEFNRNAKEFNGIVERCCKHNLAMFFFDQERKEIVTFQITPGGRRAWREFRSAVYRKFAVAWRKARKDPVPPEPPWVQWIMRVGVQHVDDKGGYFAPTFEIISKNTKADTVVFRAEREGLAAQLELLKAEAAKGQADMSAEDMYGPVDPAGALPGEPPMEVEEPPHPAEGATVVDVVEEEGGEGDSATDPTPPDDGADTGPPPEDDGPPKGKTIPW